MALTPATLDQMGNALRWKGGLGSSDNAVIVQTNDISAYDLFCLSHSSSGAGASCDVFASLDGTNYGTSPLALTDLGSTAGVPSTVVATTAERTYTFSGTFAKLQVLQNGAAIPSNVCLIASRKGGA